MLSFLRKEGILAALSPKTAKLQAASSEKNFPFPPVISFLFVFSLLSFVQIKVSRPILIMERFFPGWGWFEITLLACYSAWLTKKMLAPAQSRIWRPRIWRLFSLIFFTQLILGLFGIERFLMTGKLHLPVPALIVAGPLYRGGSFFMLILFISTVVLVGSAWCSYLCYIGAWDDTCSRAVKRPLVLPEWRPSLRTALTILVFASALGMRAARVPSSWATYTGAAFGLTGVALMLSWSRRKGQMTHCVTYCPIGLAANFLGKINPFRIAIDAGCTDCEACTSSCRYDALNKEDIRRRRPGLSCTLCGDCIRGCPTQHLHYKFLGLKPRTARALFIVLVVSIHSAFLGLARL